MLFYYSSGAKYADSRLDRNMYCIYFGIGWVVGGLESSGPWFQKGHACMCE